MKRGKVAIISGILAFSMLLTSPNGSSKSNSLEKDDDMNSLIIPDELMQDIADKIDDIDLNIEYVPYEEENIGTEDEPQEVTINTEDNQSDDVISDEVVENTPEQEDNDSEYKFNLAYVLYDNIAAYNENTDTLHYIERFQKVFILNKEDEVSLIEYITEDNETIVGYIRNENLRILTDTFVEIDKSEKVERLYVCGEIVLESPVVLGLEWSTPTNCGCYEIYAKEQGVFLKKYDENGNLLYSKYVDYWEPFDGGIGLHDAERHVHYDENGNPIIYHGWRELEDFGKEKYPDGASNGCVNETNEAARIIFENTEVGTPVLIHN